jgi:nitrous oxidase accessory protein
VNKTTIVRTGSAAAAAGLVALSSVLPLWSMTMRAPQYPKGLRLNAYGTAITGDLRELNILNHYIGMPPIEAPAFETAMFPVAVALVVVLCLLAPLHRWLWRVAGAVALVMPIAVLADLQWRLYTFGHSLDPHAPIRLAPFTPLVVGTTHMGNFVSTAMPSYGTFCLLAAALVLTFASRWTGHGQLVPRTALRRAAVVLITTGLALKTLPVAAHRSSAVPSGSSSLAARIAAAAPGATIVVDGGTHSGPLTIRGPLTLIGTNGATIDGGGTGSVVTIEGDDVVIRGLTIRNSGRAVTEEAAGIKASGNRHRIEANTIRDVYFGVHVGSGEGIVIRGNWIEPGTRHGARPGHGISVWHAFKTEIVDNQIADARDGVYLSFADGAVVERNDVTRCRYGLHSMSSLNAAFRGNTLTANLLGAALMQSDRLELRGNRIQQHREGSAAYGVLLKDIGDLVAEDNIIITNRVGIYAEGVPSQPAREAIVRRNVIAGNEVGLALQSNAALSVAENRIADNLTDVRALGGRLSASSRWSIERRGNAWSQYRGYDADRDGVGDVPHRVEDTMDALVRKNPLAQAFLYTPAHLALESAARMFPLLRHQPLLVDERPLMRADGGAR